MRQDALDHHLAGDTGVDTLRVDGSGITLDFTPLVQNRITGIDDVDLTGSGNNQLKLSLSDLIDVSDHAGLRVDGNAGDSFEMTTTGWTHGADQVLGSQTYASYTHGGATLLVDLDLSTTIA